MRAERSLRDNLHPEVRKILDQIDEIFVTQPHYAQQLWDILTALRGPDSGDEYLKVHTTAFIRGLAFPRWAETSGPMQHFTRDGWMVRTEAELRSQQQSFVLPEEPAHFVNHVRRAFTWFSWEPSRPWKSAK